MGSVTVFKRWQTIGFGIIGHDPWFPDSEQHSSMGKLRHCQCHSKEGFHLNNVCSGSQEWTAVFYVSIFRTGSVSQGFTLFYNFSMCWKENKLQMCWYRIILVHRILVLSSSSHYSNSLYYCISDRLIITIEKANDQKNKRRVLSLMVRRFKQQPDDIGQRDTVSKEILSEHHQRIEQSFWVLILLATVSYVSVLVSEPS